MTLEQLRIFVAVAEREHLTRAAEALHLTQSAVSSSIAALEASYGVKLFDRVGRGIVLTEAGRLFLGEARAVMARARAAEVALFDVAGARRGHLDLAASQTVGNHWIAARMARFAERHPGVQMSLRIANTEDAVALVLSGEADIGVVEGDVDDPKLSVTRFAGDRVVAVTPPDMQLPKDWSRLTFVARERGSGTRAILDAVLRDHRADAGQIALELPSNDAVLGAIEAGAGVSLLSDLVAKRAAETGAVCVVDIGLPERTFSLIRLKERSQTRAEKAFIDICKS